VFHKGPCTTSTAAQVAGVKSRPPANEPFWDLFGAPSLSRVVPGIGATRGRLGIGLRVTDGGADTQHRTWLDLVEGEYFLTGTTLSSALFRLVSLEKSHAFRLTAPARGLCSARALRAQRPRVPTSVLPPRSPQDGRRRSGKSGLYPVQRG
jgi:hypothetical protein